MKPTRSGALRKFRKTAKGETAMILELWNADDTSITRPQEYLSKLTGESFFDPSTFINCHPQERIEKLKAALGIDFSGIDKELESLRSTRLLVGRDRTGAEEAVKEYNDVAAERPSLREKEVVLKEIGGIDALFEKEKNARAISEDVKNRIKEKSADAENHRTFAREARAKAEKLRAGAKELDGRAVIAENKATSIEGDIHALSKDQATGYVVPDSEHERKRVLMDELAKIHDQAVTDERRTRRDELRAKAHALDEEYKSLTGKIEGLQSEKLSILASADIPVKGLEIGEKDVVINGLPFASASSGEKITLAAMIAMRIRGNIQFMSIQDGGLLDDKAMDEVDRFAREHGITVFVEIVKRSGEFRNCLVLSEGRVVGD